MACYRSSRKTRIRYEKRVKIAPSTPPIILLMNEKLLFPGKRLLIQSNSPLSRLESCKSIKQALQIHAQIIVKGLHRQIFSLSRLIAFFALSGSTYGLHHSRLIFSHILQPNLFIWNTMIRAYSRSDSPHEALILFKSMILKAVIPTNNFSFPFLLNSCARLPSGESGRGVHCHLIKNGYDSDLFITNSIIHFYSVFGDLENACNVFVESPVRDLVSFNIMINGYAHGGRPAEALCIFKQMLVSGSQPDEFTYVALLSACSVLKDLDTGKQIHLYMLKNLGFDTLNVLLKTTLVDMYAKCGLMGMADRVFNSMGCCKSPAAWSSMVSGYARHGDIMAARQLFDRMGPRDLVSWTAMISSYSQAGFHSEALELFIEMEGVGFKPDEVTMVAALSACAGLGALDVGRRLHRQYMENALFDGNMILKTALIDMYAKCGSIEVALDVFYRIPKKLKTVILFNSMISGLAQHGLGKAAITVFREMESIGLKPDGASFVGVLCACSHAGLVREGKKLFDSMLNMHETSPQIEHYGCMVDLLGRDGQLKEACDFIQKMPLKANSVIWRSLLGACRIHGNVEISVVASEKLLELDPDHGARYVLLSNVFADANKWEEARRVRKLMEDEGIQKPAGWSYIELNGTLHRFLASERSHPQYKEVELILEEMTRGLKSAGLGFGLIDDYNQEL